MTIRELTEKILADGKLSGAEQEELLNAITADEKVDAAEDEQIRRILAMIREGKLNVE